MFILGAQDHKKPFDVALWLKCMREKSKEPPRLVPGDFEESATVTLYSYFGLSVPDISHNNCRSIYLKLVRVIESLVDNGVTFCSSIEHPEDSYDSTSDD